MTTTHGGEVQLTHCESVVMLQRCAMERNGKDHSWSIVNTCTVNFEGLFFPSILVTTNSQNYSHIEHLRSWPRARNVTAMVWIFASMMLIGFGCMFVKLYKFHLLISGGLYGEFVFKWHPCSPISKKFRLDDLITIWKLQQAVIGDVDVSRNISKTARHILNFMQIQKQLKKSGRTAINNEIMKLNENRNEEQTTNYMKMSRQS